MDIHKQVSELRLISEFDLQWLPPSYLKRNTKSTEITEAWEKLPLDIRNNEEMKTYLLCTKHFEMYSIYESEFWPIATDAYSAVERMRRQFTALAFEEDHETVYGLGRWHSDAYLQYLQKKMNSNAEAFVICLYNPEHKVLQKNLVKHKFESHQVLYKKDLVASYKEKLQEQEAVGYAADTETLRRMAAVFEALRPIQYWDA
ncbi:hypothetical protein FQA39_LY08881 [Lamprigera yunnana]|nr:hypothetical protein FQA39_LY08881 [Lamprigera yunnana]